MIIRSGEISDVDTVVGLHVNPQEKTGIFHTGYGARTTAGYVVNIFIKGIGSEAALCLADIIQTISIKQKSVVGAKKVATFVPTVIKTMGEGEIKEISVSYDGRFLDESVADILQNLVERTIEAMQCIYDVSIRYEDQHIGGIVKNEKASVDRGIKVIKKLFGKEAVKITPAAMFGEDFTRYSEVTPKLVFSLIGASDDSFEYGLHNSKVTFSNDTIYYATAYLTAYALEYLKGGQ
jgi:metal-dependent amidase/aminoacylase/carboxypeptidase family protein